MAQPGARGEPAPQEVGKVDSVAPLRRHSQPAESLRAEERLNLALQDAVDLGHVRPHLAFGWNRTNGVESATAQNLITSHGRSATPECHRGL